MTFDFDRAPLSLIKTFKNGAKLYYAVWNKVIPYVAICVLPIMLLRVFIFAHDMEDKAQFGTLTTLDIILSVVGLLATIVIGFFLVLNVANEIKLFIERRHMRLKDRVSEVLSKLFPAVISALIIIVCFGLACGILSVFYVFAFSNVENWRSIYTQIGMGIVIVSLVTTYLALYIALVRSSLYLMFILYEEVGPLQAIKRSFGLIKGWRNIVGSFLLIGVIQFLMLFFSTVLPLWLYPNPWVFMFFYLCSMFVIFPWAVACILDWYLHLEKRGFYNYD